MIASAVLFGFTPNFNLLNVVLWLISHLLTKLS